MAAYLIRLDDASDYMDNNKWQRIINILDKYDIKPIIAAIPKNEDDTLLNRFVKNPDFWSLLLSWQQKGYTIGLHGYNHKFSTDCGGINPVNKYSEFACVPLDIQRIKIRNGVELFNKHGINAKVFIAPAHTFDKNTLIALSEESKITVISDMIASQPFILDNIRFIPQQMGLVRKSPLPMKVITFCYHPNNMDESAFEELNKFLVKYHKKFKKFEDITYYKKKRGLYDRILNYLYFKYR